MNYLNDKQFLKQLDVENLRTHYVKIVVLDSNEKPISEIQGRVTAGSINIDGSSSVRRSGSVTFIALEKENDLTDVNNLLSVTRRIRILIGLENNIDDRYDKIIWFPQGIFIITQPNLSHAIGGITINLSFKDKMCLLNGECGGTLPTSVTFDSYNQAIAFKEMEDGKLPTEDFNNYTVYKVNNDYFIYNVDWGTWEKTIWSDNPKDKVAAYNPSTVKSIKTPIYEIIRTLVCNYGGEALDKIFINDVPLEIKQSVRYTGTNTLYYRESDSYYTTKLSEVDLDEAVAFKYNEDVGFVYTSFVYPGDLISGIGENVCAVLDKIKSTLGNFEYFYDVNGNFVFQEIKNYLNNSYGAAKAERLPDCGKLDGDGEPIQVAPNGLSILDNITYKVSFNTDTKSVYTFTDASGLLASCNFSPNYTNLKNDFHIWGKNANGFAIHYHLAIKEKPKVMNTYYVDWDLRGLPVISDIHDEKHKYIPSDWRAELYLSGLFKQYNDIRPDIYEQELMDLFGDIYDFREEWIDENGVKRIGKFKTDLLTEPNNLDYFFDYIDNSADLLHCSVDGIGTRIYSYQFDKINKLYIKDIPNVIVLNAGAVDNTALKERCRKEGQKYTNVDRTIYKNFAIGTAGYNCEEYARDALYKYTNYNETISLTTIPIYHLEPNMRITVADKMSNIYGDYIIKSISMPLQANGTMSISAIKALERV